METEKTIKIIDCENKVSKTNQIYLRVKTQEGWMSAFDEDIIKKLKEFKGSIVKVTVAVDEKKGWKNIRAFHGLSDVGMPMDEVKEEKIGKPEPNRNATMYASYVKDIFCSFGYQPIAAEMEKNNTEIKLLMHHAIELVKQAKQAFE